jgi:hypothetical protein
MSRATRPNLRVDTTHSAIPQPNIRINTVSAAVPPPSLCVDTRRSASTSIARKARPSRFRRFLHAISPTSATSATSPSQPLLPRPQSAFGADMEQFVLAICTRPEQQLYNAPDVYEDDQTCTTKEQALYDISRRKLMRASAMPPPPPLFQSANGLGNYTVITAGNSFSGSTRTRKWS